MTPKQIVKAYYEADLANDIGIMERFLHKDCALSWHSSKGFYILGFEEIKVLYEDISNSYSTFRTKISHLLEDGNSVTSRYSIWVTPLETPEEEVAMAHFITIWEIKDQKLFRGYEISQPAVSTKESLDSFKVPPL